MKKLAVAAEIEDEEEIILLCLSRLISQESAKFRNEYEDPRDVDQSDMIISESKGRIMILRHIRNSLENVFGGLPDKDFT